MGFKTKCKCEGEFIIRKIIKPRVINIVWAL